MIPCRSGWACAWFTLVCSASLATAEESTPPLGVPLNGYTYVAPSYYLTPPVIVTPAPYPAPYVVAPAPITIYEPAFLHTSVVPYDPVWPYAYMGLPGAYYRERVTVRPNRVNYRLRTYGPRPYPY